MNDERSFFRSEALEHWADRKGPGNLLRARARWLDVVFWLVVVLFVAGVVLSVTVRVSTYVVGPVRYDEEADVLVARLPETSRGSIAPGARVDVRTLDGTWVRGLSAAPGANGLVQLRLPPAVTIDPHSLAGGTARVVVGTEPILTAFVPGVRALEGD